jgi:hypothetical protein
MCQHTRLHLAHEAENRQQHFEQDNALVYLGALNRATSPRRWFGSFPLGLLHERPALNPIVPHDHGIARVGLAPVTCVSGRGEYPTHRLENAPARRPVIQKETDCVKTQERVTLSGVEGC